MKNKQDSSNDSSSRQTLFGGSRVFLYLSLIVLLGLGIYFRLLNITNPPLENNAWRQLASASYARGLYYQMLPDADPEIRQRAINIAAETVHLEPTITEALVAVSYLAAGGEYLWIFRLWTTLFWLIGGIALFAFVRRMTSADGALVALGYYLLLPFGNAITRQFLPEPLMVMWIVLALYAFSHWLENQTWKWTILTGVFAGLALLTKVFAVFPLAPAIILASSATFGFRQIVKKLKFWTIGALAGIIPGVYYFFFAPQSGSNYLGTWVLPYMSRLKDVWFYIGWLHQLNGTFNLAIILIAIVSCFLLEKRWRFLCLGLWIGYGLLGAAVPELIFSHMYYNLPLVAIIAISLGAVSALVMGKLSERGTIWKILFLGVALVGIGYTVYMSRKDVMAVDYRGEPQKWEHLAEVMQGANCGITEDYGARLNYFGWRAIRPYPYSFDFEMGRMAGHEFDVNADNLEYFTSKVTNCEYFVVTMFSELEAQPYLKEILYERFPIYVQEDWFIIFDLTQSK